jgi:L,D-transpeptidase YcbB
VAFHHAPLTAIARRTRAVPQTGIVWWQGLLSTLLLMMALASLTATGPAAANSIQDPVEALRVRVESLALDPRAGPVPVTDPWFLIRLYERRQFNPVWTTDARLDELLAALEGSTAHGLDPEDYHVAVLHEARESLNDQDYALAAASLDVLATDALARYAYHLRFGKVNPEALEPSWNFTRTLGDTDPIEAVLQLIDADDLGAALDRLAPQEARYRDLMQGLAAMRSQAAAGGWPSVPSGETLRPGMRGARVIALRERLTATGDLPDDAITGGADADLYDMPLSQAVRAFQERHGLDADAIVGPRTLAALNVPVESRIDQLRINLERARWIFRDLEDRYIISNIARFRTTLVENGEVVWTTRSVVGLPYRQTPVFRARMTYLVLNPTWTVPPGILSRDILPEIRRDPGTLARRNMTVLDFSGRPVDPAAVDFSGTRGFPYMIRQEPGPNNALGRVKFMFPNAYHVYMHDTPAQELFDRAERTFSSGCIRLENPLELAEILLDGAAGWDRAAIDRAIADGRSRTVTLPRALTVLLIYATAVPENGEIIFLPDVYNRDARLLAALDADFEFSPPLGYQDALR